MGSAYAAAVYISSVLKLPKDKKVYVVGMSGIEEELREEGISFLGGTVRLPALRTGTRPHAARAHRTPRTTRSRRSASSTGRRTPRSARCSAGSTRP